MTTAGHPAGMSTDSLLQRWLAERQDLLRHYCALTALLQQGTSRTALATKLDRFCEVLVDYVSAGHFEVYRKLLEAGERRGGEACAECASLYRLIVPTTSVALDFNDRYFKGPAGQALREDLSRLGQMLASRFDWEDALIDTPRTARAVA